MYIVSQDRQNIFNSINIERVFIQGHNENYGGIYINTISDNTYCLGLYRTYELNSICKSLSESMMEDKKAFKMPERNF